MLRVEELYKWTTFTFTMPTYLAGGETPRLTEHFFEEWWLYLEVLGDNVEREEMTVDATSCHCITVAILVHLGRRLK